MLPHTLLCLLLSATFASSQQLTLNSLSSFSPSNLPNPPRFSLPSSNKLTISVAVCSDFPPGRPPKFTFNDGANDLEIPLFDGQGSWTGAAARGGTLLAVNVDNLSFEVGVSEDEPLHQTLTDLPLLGDTTSSQALLFSPIFSKPEIDEPTFPNYTFPPPNPPRPSPPMPAPNFTLVLAPTSQISLTSLPQTGCRLSAIQSAGNSLNQSAQLREDGWRSELLVEGLTPSTNYTAYLVQSGTRLSGPIYFATKSASFSCPLVHALPFCPSVAYAAPLPAPPAPATVHDPSTLPSNVSQMLVQYLTNFTVTLSTFPCGRDIYSPLMTCADCYRAYRTWLCYVSIPRCTDSTQTLPPSGAQVHLPALSAVQASAKPRVAALDPFPSAYTTVLPCIETCTAVDRACPNFLKFACPSHKFNANESYGLGFIDGIKGDEGKGQVGAPVDRWGNIWCNG